MDEQQPGGNTAGGPRGRIFERLAARRQAQGGLGQGAGLGGRFGRGRFGRWQGGGDQGGRFGGRLEAFLRARQGGGQGQEGPLAAFLRQRRQGGGSPDSAPAGSERDLLMRRAERLEKLLEDTYEQLERLDAAAAAGEVIDTKASEVKDEGAPPSPGVDATGQSGSRG